VSLVRSVIHAMTSRARQDIPPSGIYVKRPLKASDEAATGRGMAGVACLSRPP
jgi:hypothetical protein